MNCPVGQEDYNGICVPTYFTPAQKQQAYDEWHAAANKGKLMKKILFGIMGLAIVAGIISTVMSYH